jgi:hypothetical protein
MGALLGFIMGYYLGTKAGPERYEELRKAWQTIVNSEEFQDLLATGTAVWGSAVEQGGSMLFPRLRAMTAGNGDVAGAWKTLTEYFRSGSLANDGDPLAPGHGPRKISLAIEVGRQSVGCLDGDRSHS